MTDAPIGIFDSGVGGLTVARALTDQLPGEDLVYLGDTAHVPYGPKPIADVRRHALACLDQLMDAGAKLLVIACNSAAAACLHDARERYSVPVVEVIRPAVRRAVAATHNGRVGVIGTSATITSGAYEDAFAAAPHITVTGVACPEFVEFVERGITSGSALHSIAQRYLTPLRASGIDTLVLGCTHYPLLAGLLNLVMGNGVTLVSSADEAAKKVYRLLTEGVVPRRADDESRPARHRFIATGDPAPFERLTSRFLGPTAARVETLSATSRHDNGSGDACQPLESPAPPRQRLP
ncbi:glutamate racemase [Salinispora arenicola]|uniref:glutamate racemase n=1 Tax=Salinispora arenicola TaxID=168697 RepID=UPI00036C6A4B|nr:glutamate racemase [Salinispora arenicola]MCN0177317.1 glutamate racemase [Salinispora arenicola]NIL55865.1 glutamate racemase [Salinispora arenicola]NIL60553.1 glutamate racemase [Salinispora arenicola]